MRKNDEEEADNAEVGDKANKIRELDDITSMCNDAILERINKITADDYGTQPSTSGTVDTSLTSNTPEGLELIPSVIISPKPTSRCEIYKVLHSVTQTDDLPTIPSSTPPPTYYRTPPTYSAVMRMGPKDHKKILEMDSSKIFARVPPPSYAEVEGIWSDLPRQNSSEEVLFGPDPVYMVCPHCSAIVVTETYTQRSTATHLTALVLCLFGCWPCCLLPYFMDSCKNTYHHCPVCNYFFGSYHPW